MGIHVLHTTLEELNGEKINDTITVIKSCKATRKETKTK